MGWMKKVKRAVKRHLTTMKKAYQGISGKGEEEDRSEAAAKLMRGSQTKQAGSGALTFNEEHYE